ncbi:hypothetical protein TNCT_484651 [Trichonephila clavata]|uniref:Uncharacterized protein n=1 Tax=Trichonephila clavata TaxID=2740835 RepID=A0A8X6GZI3_TRICU|nr:hypothetical protein TNCT_484651 [Trichonephila clavata]
MTFRNLYRLFWYGKHHSKKDGNFKPPFETQHQPHLKHRNIKNKYTFQPRIEELVTPNFQHAIKHRNCFSEERPLLTKHGSAKSRSRNASNAEPLVAEER